MPLSIYCGLLHAVEVVVVPTLFAGITLAFLWGVFQYITRGDYDLYHTLGSKSLMLWACLFTAVLMLLFALALVFFSFFGATNTSCGF